MQKLSKFDLLVFDIDGVLLDVTHSFPLVINKVIKQTLDKFCLTCSELPYGEQEEKFLKLHGGFNDDWDIALFLANIALKKKQTNYICQFYNPTLEEIKEASADHYFPTEKWITDKFGTIINRDNLRAMCDELYSNRENGAYKTEKNLIKISWKEIPLPVAIYTGRYGIEYEHALECLGWEDFPRSHAITIDDEVSKPSPKGLEILANRFGSKHLAFFGDTGSDKQCLDSYGRGEFFAIGNLLKDYPNHFDNIQDALKKALEL